MPVKPEPDGTWIPVDDRSGPVDDVSVYDRETEESCAELETLFARVRLPLEMPYALEEDDDSWQDLPGFTPLVILGTGTFGRVWLALDERLQRRVAIKVPRGRLCLGVGDRDRVLDEARIVAQLAHPGIVPLYQCLDADGRYVLVSEYVEGGTLEDHLRQGPVSAWQAATWVAQVADALAHAHQRQVVHRDLKPTNLLIDSHGQVRITDFGLAIHDDRQAGALGQIAGTLEYMAPEQLPGSGQFVDGRADLWSLGVIWYRLLTGRFPFSGANRDELMMEIRRRQPKPFRQLVPEIPLVWQDLCLRCLQQDVAARWSSASDLAKAVRRAMAAPAAGRRRMLAALLGVSAAVLGGGWALHAWTRRSLPGTPHVPRADLRLRHFRVAADGTSQHDLGIIGTGAYAVLLGDDVRVELRFSQAKYFYLWELTSQGQVIGRYPSDPNSPPAPRAMYTFPEDPRDMLVLDDGPGASGWCVVASDRPLPALTQWQRSAGPLPWSRGTATGVWRFTHDGYAGDYYQRERGSVQRRAAAPAEFVRVCEFLSQQAPQCAITAMCFPVLNR